MVQVEGLSGLRVHLRLPSLVVTYEDSFVVLQNEIGRVFIGALSKSKVVSGNRGIRGVKAKRSGCCARLPNLHNESWRPSKRVVKAADRCLRHCIYSDVHPSTVTISSRESREKTELLPLGLVVRSASASLGDASSPRLEVFLWKSLSLLRRQASTTDFAGFVQAACVKVDTKRQPSKKVGRTPVCTRVSACH